MNYIIERKTLLWQFKKQTDIARPALKYPLVKGVHKQTKQIETMKNDLAYAMDNTVYLRLARFILTGKHNVN